MENLIKFSITTSCMNNNSYGQSIDCGSDLQKAIDTFFANIDNLKNSTTDDSDYLELELKKWQFNTDENKYEFTVWSDTDFSANQKEELRKRYFDLNGFIINGNYNLDAEILPLEKLKLRR
jgi:hypothetical protein